VSSKKCELKLLEVAADKLPKDLKLCNLKRNRINAIAAPFFIFPELDQCSWELFQENPQKLNSEHQLQHLSKLGHYILN
jgi:hypothetical protein